ncbi:plasma membrane protein Pth11-like protein [Hypoxylon sp. FL1284]|nr:plasma membrane protein Pth11-like protein [Hypoxylon sp. FL1284]
MAIEQKYYQTPGHVVAAAVVMSLLDIGAVGLRLWIRVKQRQALKADDWLIIPATLLTIGIGISLIYGVSRETLGYPTRMPPDFAGNPLELKTDQITLLSKIEWAFNMMLPLLLGCVKASFLFFYRRIFAVSRQGVVYFLLIGLIFLVFAWSVAFFFVFLFMCHRNFFAIWGSTMDLIQYCAGSMNLALSLCITDFAYDVVIIFFPVPLIWRLSLSTGKKIAVSAVFLLGAVTAAASLARLIIMARIATVGFDPSEDEILVITEYLYWGMIECGVSVFAACLPSLQFLFRGLSWTSFVESTKSIFGYNLSKAPLNSASKDAISTDHIYNVSYTEDSSKARGAQNLVHVSSDNNEQKQFASESYATDDIKGERVL